jgi:hypothetical protein
VPRPFAGAFKAIGRALDSVFGSGASSTIGPIRIGDPLLIGALVVVVIAIALVIARMEVRGRVRDARVAVQRRRGGPDAGALAREADVAEQAGEFERAVRLRFAAGIAALAERGAIPRPATLRAAQIGAHLHSSLFDRLNIDFERVAYGGRHAQAATAQDARTAWQQLLAEVEA